MEGKIPAVIRSITLDGRTYHNVALSPTLINFFYGKNGTGKTTIAQNIRDSIGIAPIPIDYDVLVYDHDFIAHNIREDSAMPGVFSINEGNIEKQQEIADKESQMSDLKDRYREQKSSYDDKTKKPAALRLTLAESCWKSTAQFRADFPLAMRNKRGSKSVFVDELLRVKSPAETDVSELKTLYDTAFGSDSTTYPLLKTVQPIQMEKIPGFELLGNAVVSSADTPFANFIKAIGATDWIKRSHDQFAHAAGNQCPYCSQTLPDDYEQKLASCFNAQYEKDCQMLQSFKATYESTAGSLLAALRENLNNTFPRNDFTKYKEILDTITAVIELNRKTLSEKISSPASAITLEGTDDKICELNTIITDLNAAIKENNDILASRQAKQDECTSAVWKHMAFINANDIASYHSSVKTAQAEIKKLKDAMEQITADGKRLRGEISQLSSQIVNVDATMNSINQKLTDSGFQGFHIQKKKDEPNKYEIIRDDGLPAHGLSEGERNFIAFLYFYHKVLGRETADSTFKDRIVVIDDPVSSMDSSSLFIVSSIVRELLSVCLNNGIAAKQEAPRFIKQMFVLTHNAFFHKEVSYAKLKYYHSVNFYLVKKVGNVSTIDLCVRKDPFSEKPAVEHNYSPVHNSYAALWKEYKEVVSSTALLRVVRQILEYYFIQISGYEGQNLTERILKHEEVFIRTNTDGIENKDLLQSVDTLLRYVGSDLHGFNDGLDYIDGTTNVETIRDTFHKIFTAMEQEQHYEMMMNSVI